jgi:hypothetical protein
MRIRLPKPLHGWRQFAGEVGIIVIGVLIALVIGQAAKAWQDGSDSADARASIRAEIGANLGKLAQRARTQRCIERRLDEIDALLARAADRQPFAPPNWIGRPQIWHLLRSQLDAASGGGRASLLTPDEQYSYSDIFAAFTAIDRAQDREQSAWAQLRGLEVVENLSPTELAVMRGAVQEARLQNWRVRISSKQAREFAGELGVQPAVYRITGSQSICVDLMTPRVDALRQLGKGYDYGEP